MKNSWRLFIFVVATSLPFSGFSAPKTKKTVVQKTQKKAEKKAPEVSETIPKILNLAEISKELRLDRFKDRKFNRRIKIAILDNGFKNWEKEKGKTLPEDTQYHPGPSTRADDIENHEMHGTFMAVLVAQVIKASGAEADYELHLFNTQGFTKFAGGKDKQGRSVEGAVQAVAKGNFDVVLHSQVWEYSGNGDGAGYVNMAVDQAIDAGVIWINAAGDFAKLTYRGPVESDGDWLKLYQKAEKKKTTDGIRVRCRAPKREQCVMRLVLAWSDVKDRVDVGTNQDLDVFLCRTAKDCDPTLEKNSIVARSVLKQRETTGNGETGVSLYPRELFEAKLNSGTYFVRVKNNSKNFDENSLIRITVGGAGIDMPDHVEGETLLAPADHPHTITVGASDHIQSSRSVMLKRPDVNVKSKVTLASGLKLKGQPASATIEPSTSGAAALAAGLTVLHLGIDTDRKREPLISTLRLVGEPVRALASGVGTPVPGTKEPLHRAIVAEQAREEAARLERERVEKERAEVARLEAERIEKENAEIARVEAEKKAELARIEAEKKAEIARIEAEKAEAAKREADRIAAEKAAREKAEAAQREAERLEAEARAREKAEAERVAAEKLAREKAEAERIVTEMREKAEAARKEAERLEAEAQKLEAEKKLALTPKTAPVAPKLEVRTEAPKAAAPPVKKDAVVPPLKKDAIVLPLKKDAIVPPLKKESARAEPEKAAPRKETIKAAPRKETSSEAAPRKTAPRALPKRDERDRTRREVTEPPRKRAEAPLRRSDRRDEDFVRRDRGSMNCAIEAPMPRLYAPIMDVLRVDPKATTIRFQGRPGIVTTYNFRAQYRMRPHEILYATSKGIRILTPEFIRSQGIDNTHVRIFAAGEIPFCR